MISDDEIWNILKDVAITEGINLGLEGALCLAAYKKLLTEGHISKRDQTVIVNNSRIQKFPIPALTK